MANKIFFDGEGFAGAVSVTFNEEHRLQDLKVELAEKIGCRADELILFIEDEGELIEVDVRVMEHPHRHKTHHVHRCRTIKVMVHYGDKTAEHEFHPSTRIQKILDWAVAVKKFAIDPSIAPEMQLTLEGKTEALPGSAHIGRYAKHDHCQVELSLVRGDMHQGS
jgi:hypothetical protein